MSRLLVPLLTNSWQSGAGSEGAKQSVLLRPVAAPPTLSSLFLTARLEPNQKVFVIEGGYPDLRRALKAP